MPFVPWSAAKWSCQPCMGCTASYAITFSSSAADELSQWIGCSCSRPTLNQWWANAEKVRGGGCADWFSDDDEGCGCFKCANDGTGPKDTSVETSWRQRDDVGRRRMQR
ncbi:MAG: hypothetical protein FRX49_00880 [Trebouxia sp. A1-2]|nr:MAG: hypothetical protein FRX49_00880 [Trebouxia sp. A1-2]